MTRVREASAADLTIIGGILGRCGLPADDIGDGRVSFLVAEDGGKIVGTIGMESHPPLGLLRSAAVNPRSRRRGVGRLLVAELIERARKDGLGGLVLLTTTAEKFFRDAGFATIDRGSLTGPVLGSGQFTGTRCASAAVMMMDLGGSR